MSGPHPSHLTRTSMDASSYDEICVNCGATDQVPGGWGALAWPCTTPEDKRLLECPRCHKYVEQGAHTCAKAK